MIDPSLILSLSCDKNQRKLQIQAIRRNTDRNYLSIYPCIHSQKVDEPLFRRQGELSPGATSQVSYSDINKIIILTNAGYHSDKGNRGEVCSLYKRDRSHESMVLMSVLSLGLGKTSKI